MQRLGEYRDVGFGNLERSPGCKLIGMTRSLFQTKADVRIDQLLMCRSRVLLSD
jgi:hypothetical protein